MLNVNQKDQPQVTLNSQESITVKALPEGDWGFDFQFGMLKGPIQL